MDMDEDEETRGNKKSVMFKDSITILPSSSYRSSIILAQFKNNQVKFCFCVSGTLLVLTSLSLLIALIIKAALGGL